MEYPDIFKRKNYSIFVPMIKFDYNDLVILILKDNNNNKDNDKNNSLEKHLESLWLQLKSETKYQFGNPQFLVSNSNGDLFTFSYYKHELRIWTMREAQVSHIVLTNDYEKNKLMLMNTLEYMDKFSIIRKQESL
jgi:hypothetical protein